MVTSWNDSDETTQVFDSERLEGAASGAERWYISPDGKTKEVLAAREIIERARAGSLSDSTLVWRDGLSDWTRLDAVPELMQAVRAFRTSSSEVEPADAAPTLIKEPPSDADSIEGTSAPAREGAHAAGGRNLPPLSPAPGARTGGLPPLAAPPVVSPRPILQTASGAPLPPPPALPPLPGRQSASDPRSDDGPSAAGVGAPSASAEPRSRTSQAVAEVVGGLMRRAKPIVASTSQRAKAYVERDYDIPRLGKMNGRLVAAVAGAVILVGVIVWAAAKSSAPDAPNPEGTTAAGAGSMDVTSSQPTEEPAVDLDDEANSVGEARAVSLKELKSLKPGEKAPEVSPHGPVPSTTKKEFDVYAAKAALTAAAEKATRCKQGPKGEGSVRVKIAPSGKVVSVAVTTPSFQGSRAATCIEQVFRQATMAPFTGDEKTVYKKFFIE